MYSSTKRERERPQSSSGKPCQTMMDIYVDYSCEDDSETGRTKLTVPGIDTTSIRDVKYAIQAAIQAPVCDQQLFYQEQPVTDDDMTLSRLYFREGDCFEVKFLAVVDIARLSELVDVLKNFAHEIVEKFNRQLPVINRRRRREDFFSVRHKAACLAIKELQDSFFSPWKCLRTIAQRHFFVQEGGFEAFMEVFKFSRQIYQASNVNESSVETTTIPDRPKQFFNESQLYLQSRCLDFLWDFGETRQDRKFLLSKDVFPLVVESLLLQPPLLEDTGQTGTARRIVDINESALGPFGALVEYDPDIQEEVSKMLRLIDKLLFITDRCQSESAGYALCSSQDASNNLLCCTWNVKSAQPLVDCGALKKMLNITQKLLIDKDSAAPLRYYCCLFLARLRSAPLVRLDRDTCVAIDELIDVFLEQNVPNEISKWEEDTSYVWMSIMPLVHLAFAAGNENFCNQKEVVESDTTKNKRAYFFKSKHPNATIAEFNKAEAETSRCKDRGKNVEITFLESKQSKAFTTDLDEADKDDDDDDVREFQSSLYPMLNSDNRVEKNGTSCKRRKIDNTEITTPVSEDYNCVTGNRKNQFTWPGSPSTQKLEIFSLMHMFSFKENQQLALAENLLPYLVCLSWHLKHDEKEKLRTSLANFHDDFSPPSLKVIAKSVLALVNGLDIVYKL